MPRPRPLHRSWRNLPQQLMQIEPPREHRQLPFGRARPGLLRTIPIKLHAVVVGVPQVQRLADPVIGGAVQLDFRIDQPPQGVRERGAGGIKNRQVVKPRRARRRR